MNCTYAVIIGAPRSGTNMLRDVLTGLSGVTTWPCDEINYIWRHGNVRYPTDEFTADMARPEVVRFIRRQFEELERSQKPKVIVEKTCANSLRVGFVDRVLPEARYISIVRDGLDVIASAEKRWKADLDIPYLLKKMRYVPFSDLPYYATKYLANRIHRIFSEQGRLAYWGPAFNGLEDCLASCTLEEICALQWQRCVVSAQDALNRIDRDRVCHVVYEQFVSNPAEELVRIARFIGIDLDAKSAGDLVRKVSAKSVGKGRQELDGSTKERIMNLIGPVLKSHGYIG